jgi:V/A-type H+/Na+-transporting ATPase subunit I
MITKMKKLSILLHRMVLSSFIEKIQDMGVVHVDLKETKSHKLSELMTLRKRLSDTLEKLSKHKTTEESAFIKAKSDVDILELLAKSDNLHDQLENCQMEISRVNKNIIILEPWGDTNTRLADQLKAKGIYLLYYKVFQKQFSKLELSDHHIEIINNKGGNVYFVLIQNSKNNLLPVENMILPEVSLTECKQELKDLKGRMELVNKEILSIMAYTGVIKANIAELTDKIIFYEAEGSCDEYYDGKITSMSGWVPEVHVPELEEYLKSQKDIVYMVEDVPEDLAPEDVPIILKNDRFSKLFEPIAKLFALPNYKELDLTPFFAPFYVIFYGFCVGDSGYGFVLLLLSIFGFIYLKKLRSFAILGVFLSVSIIFWGLLSGTSMGVSMFDSGVPLLSNLALFKPVHLFYLALIIGLLQILFGMLVKVLRYLVNAEYLGALSPLGWFMLVLSLVALYLNSKTADSDFGVGRVFFYFIHSIPLKLAYVGTFVGIFFILFFNDMRANVFLRFGKGLWELYGITGVVGDLLSYIRLFALGLSSAILGSVVNMIALKILSIPIPGFSHLLFILFLVVGHFGNLAMAGLGAFVHPLRLTFVEFYKNAGFTGGGMAYRPLRKTQQGG